MIVLRDRWHNLRRRFLVFNDLMHSKHAMKKNVEVDQYLLLK